VQLVAKGGEQEGEVHGETTDDRHQPHAVLPVERLEKGGREEVERAGWWRDLQRWVTRGDTPRLRLQAVAVTREQRRGEVAGKWVAISRLGADTQPSAPQSKDHQDVADSDAGPEDPAGEEEACGERLPEEAAEHDHPAPAALGVEVLPDAGQLDVPAAEGGDVQCSAQSESAVRFWPLAATFALRKATLEVV
jgi:hypothetical protein